MHPTTFTLHPETSPPQLQTFHPGPPCNLIFAPSTALIATPLSGSSSRASHRWRARRRAFRRSPPSPCLTSLAWGAHSFLTSLAWGAHHLAAARRGGGQALSSIHSFLRLVFGVGGFGLRSESFRDLISLVQRERERGRASERDGERSRKGERERAREIKRERERTCGCGLQRFIFWG